MKSLNRTLRKDLENAIKRARLIAEKGAIEALVRLAVGAADPWSSMSDVERQLRRRLRARARQLGDTRNSTTQVQDVSRLIQECAYEHWHRLIFSKFLAESNLLIEPSTQVPISIEECKELALEQNLDWLTLASEFAQKMLPSIFRQGDPVLEIRFTSEIRQELDEIIGSLPLDVFTAKDSLGWIYQFWQAQKKEEVNQSGKKIGADELPAVTQLFTEDYMVEFLLDNTIGAWWAGKHGPIKASDEVEARKVVSLSARSGLPSIDWQYLRFIQDQSDQLWRPAAGTFSGWPKIAKEVTLLDPCMGSGHFLVFALPVLARLRMEEENLNTQQALSFTLEKNIYGLEIDPRCAQIAAFNLALSAWKIGGHRALPSLNLACSGLAPHVSENEWIALAGDNDRLKRGMARLHGLFKDAPVLGSLINPHVFSGDMVEAGFQELRPLFEKAMSHETNNEQVHEMAVAAHGVAKAAEILAGQFTLVATNVPYLGRPKQHELLRYYSERAHPDAKADLATCFVERCIGFCAQSGNAALVTPQSWLFQDGYKELRASLLAAKRFGLLVRLGPKGFQTPMWDFNVALVNISKDVPSAVDCFQGIDVAALKTPREKADTLAKGELSEVSQAAQTKNPDSIITIESVSAGSPFSDFAFTAQGFATSDNPTFIRCYWELAHVRDGWVFTQSASRDTEPYQGRQDILLWEDGKGAYYRHAMALKEAGRMGGWKSGYEAWGRNGVLISEIGRMPATLYTGDMFDHTAHAVVPKSKELWPVIWTFCSSEEFTQSVRRVSQKLNVTNETLVKIPFDLAHWQKVAAEKYPHGLPKPFSGDPTQWLFNGHPAGADQPLHVAVARLLGYRWPRQTGSSFPDCPALSPDGLEAFADPDGIVCLPSINREEAGASCLRALMMKAYGSDWSATKERDLLLATGSQQSSLEMWLRDEFFKQHCAVFHNRPFIWHIWDGVSDGFSALVNYHKLAEGNGEGRKLLEKITYTYLGDWISRQEQEQKSGTAGADAKVAAAKHLKGELEKILIGEPPYDIFIRWKPLHKQPVGWEPDVNDGVRINIRPFLSASTLGSKSKSGSIFRFSPKMKWDKDRGKEPLRSKSEFPWFWSSECPEQDFLGTTEFHGHRWNNVHYSNSVKQLARKNYTQTSSSSGGQT